MYKAIIEAAQSMTNIRGRYDFSTAVLDIELSRIINSRDFAASYGKSEWLAGDKTVNCVEVQSDEYKKLVVCLADGTSEDIASQIDSSNTDVECPVDTKGLSVTVSCGVISIRSDVAIVAVRGLSKLQESEIKKWLLKEHSAVFVAYLRWQLLADIEANSANIAYNGYVRSLAALSKLKVV